VFLSYAYSYNADGFVEQFRERLAQELEVQIGEPPTVFLDADRMRPGQSWSPAPRLTGESFQFPDIVPYAAGHPRLAMLICHELAQLPPEGSAAPANVSQHVTNRGDPMYVKSLG
jgi:hypothetical protein